MPDLSVIIPARNEEFLQRTIEDVLANAEGDTEVIAVLDGYWPDTGMPQHPKVHIIHHENSIGQRAAVNEGVNLSNSKYIMKLDAHCAMGKGFDVKLMADCEYDWTVLPRMYTLHAFDWRCKRCGVRIYQGGCPKKCESCGHTDFERVMVWKRNPRKRTDYMWIDRDLRMRYFDGGCLRPYGDAHILKRQCHHKYRSWAQGDITDVMVGVGCCFFMHRERFFELGGMDEGHGGWGQMAVEVAMKSWLSGGRQVINKKTWFAHLFRTQSGFGFPYKISHKDQEAAREYSRKMWNENNWPLQKHDLQWMIDKFGPLPGWHTSLKKKEKDEKLIVNAALSDIVPSQQAVKNPSKGIVYYTDNRCEDRIAGIVRDQIKKCCYGTEIISVSQFPVDLGKNIVVPWERSTLTMFKQILKGLEESTANVVFLTEHDVLYHPSHFDFVPPGRDKIYYNLNLWQLRLSDGFAVYFRAKRVSQICAYKNVLLEHYRKRVELVEKNGFTRKMGFEPGSHGRAERVDDLKSDVWVSEHPNIDIKHGKNLTAARWSPTEFRSQRNCRDWKESDSIPGWGKTQGRIDDFLYEVSR